MLKIKEGESMKGNSCNLSLTTFCCLRGRNRKEEGQLFVDQSFKIRLCI
jgi:hypothetical protein